MIEPEANFSEHWLAARERFDTIARDRHWPLVAAQLSTDQNPISRVLDMGCGTGSNLRYLRARLAPLMTPPISDWRGFDADQCLLDAARRSTQSSTQSSTHRSPRCDHVQYLRADLADPTNWPEFTANDLVSASALIDLVSEPWLTELITRCARARAALLLALTYDGHSRWQPGHPQDLQILSSFNSDQTRDKGFGVALGSAAVTVAHRLLVHAGYRVSTTRSDWLLDARRRNARQIIEPLIANHCQIAMRAEPTAAIEFEAWAAERRRQLRGGRLRVRVGHFDLLAISENFS